MKKKVVWLVVSSLVVLALLAASCGGGEEKKKEEAPAVKEAAPAVPAGMVKVTLTKLDGTTVEKMVEKPKYGGTFIMSGNTGPSGWDEAVPGVAPYEAIGGWKERTQEELLEGRWDRGPSGTNEVGWRGSGWWANPDFYQGRLAESWEFPDDTTIIFHIRKGVHYALDPNSEASRLVGGREFTAEDAAYTIRRIYIDTPSSTMWSMAGVSRPIDVYTTDKYTLVVKNTPGQQGYTWEYVGDWMSNYPPEVIEKYGDMNDWENVVGTGPFILTDYLPQSSGTWVRNPNYWMKDPLIPENQLPYIDEVRTLIIPDASTAQSAMRTGKIDWCSSYAVPDEEQSLLLINSRPQLKYVSSLDPVYWYFGFRLDKELPFNDIRVRRALSMAINWKEIVDTTLNGRGEYLIYKVMPLRENPDLWEAYTPLGQLPPAPDGFDNNKLYTYHPEEAKKLLAEAGYPDGFKTQTLVPTFGNMVDIITIFKEYWQKNLNVDLAIDVKEFGAFYSMFVKKTFNEGCMMGRWGDQPYAMCNVRTDSEYNLSMSRDPKMDEYYNKMTAVYFDVPARTKILKEMNQYVISQVLYYVPPVGNSYTIWWPWVKGYNGELATGVDNYSIPKYIWIDQELKKSMGY